MAGEQDDPAAVAAAAAAAAAEPGAGAADENDDDDALLGAQVINEGGQEFIKVPRATIVGLRKSGRELKREVGRLTPIAERATHVQAELERAAPIINAVIADKGLMAQALRAVNGTHKTPEAVVQPQDDPDAVAMAEHLNLFMADGMTPDAARGQRVIAMIGSAAKNAASEAVRPFAGTVVNSQAERNLQSVLSATDANGAPLATPESVREVAKMLPPQLLAQEGVAGLLELVAIGLDRKHGRTPQVPDEPLYLASAGARGRREAPVAVDRAHLERLGLTEKDYRTAEANLSRVAGTRGGITFEGA